MRYLGIALKRNKYHTLKYRLTVQITLTFGISDPYIHDSEFYLLESYAPDSGSKSAQTAITHYVEGQSSQTL